MNQLHSIGNRAASLKDFFWEVIKPVDKQPDRRIAELALKAMQRVVELSKDDDFSAVNVLAEARFRIGDTDSAIAAQQKAIGLVRAELKDQADSLVKELQERVKEYRKAAEKKSE
jgi:uncharacterized LabA/DUF88 family protein